MSGWQPVAIVLVTTLVPLALVIARRSRASGVVAASLAGTNAVLGLLVIAVGTHRQPFAALAVVLAIVGLISSLAAARYLEERG